MANEITVTKADVRPLGDCIIRRKAAGGTLYVGDLVYIASDGDVEQADGSAIGTVLGTYGIVISAPEGATTVSAGDMVDIVVSGHVTGYSGMTPGGLFYVSDTSGRLSTVAGTKSLIGGQIVDATTVFVRIQPVDLS